MSRKKLESVTPEFIRALRTYGAPVKQTASVKATVESYRGRTLSGMLIPCGVNAAFEVQNAPRNPIRGNSTDSWMSLVSVLKAIKLPIADYLLRQIVDDLGNIVQVETLKTIIKNIEDVQKEVHDEGGVAEVSYNVPVYVRGKEGEILLRTMNNIVIEGEKSVFIYLVRSSKRTKILDIERWYYVSMLSNLKQYPGKDVYVSALISIGETQDIVPTAYWAASEGLLGIKSEEREDWYDDKFKLFIYKTHKDYPSTIQDDQRTNKSIKQGEHCAYCNYSDFCKKYIIGGKDVTSKSKKRTN